MIKSHKLIYDLLKLQFFYKNYILKNIYLNLKYIIDHFRLINNVFKFLCRVKLLAFKCFPRYKFVSCV